MSATSQSELCESPDIVLDELREHRARFYDSLMDDPDSLSRHMSDLSKRLAAQDWKQTTWPAAQFPPPLGDKAR
jgi:hypothetical protein